MQFSAAAARLGLGDFIAAEPIRTGLFGQNVFLTTSEGEFVFRGAPHWYGGRRDDRYQFAKEALFIRLVHEGTGAPAPWPPRYDPTSDIFGWPYLVMPRMPGTCFNERSIRKALAAARPPRGRRFDRRDARAAATPHRAGRRRLRPRYRRARATCGRLWRPSDPLAVRRRRGRRQGRRDDWRRHGLDRDLARDARDLPARPVTFVHGDYKLDNMTVVERDGALASRRHLRLPHRPLRRLARDIVRAACAYLDTEPELAQVMIEAWRADGGDAAGLAPWLPLYVASERSSIWAGFVKRDARPAWSAGKTFRSWAEAPASGRRRLLRCPPTPRPRRVPERTVLSARVAAPSELRREENYAVGSSPTWTSILPKLSPRSISAKARRDRLKTLADVLAILDLSGFHERRDIGQHLVVVVGREIADEEVLHGTPRS